MSPATRVAGSVEAPPWRSCHGGVVYPGTLYCVVQHRIQLYLDESQYHWLKQRAGERGSIAGVVRDLIDSARAQQSPDLASDPLIRYLTADQPATSGEQASTVQTLDEDVYG